MTDPEQNKVSIDPVPLEQQPEIDALVQIVSYSDLLEQQTPESVISTCEEVRTAVWHPSERVADAALDVFKRVVDSSGDEETHMAVLTGMRFAIERPDGYGLDKAGEIIGLLQDGYFGGAGLPSNHILMRSARVALGGSEVVPEYEEPEPSNVQRAAWSMRSKLFFKGRDYRIHEEMKIEAAKNRLDSIEDQTQGSVNFIETMHDEHDAGERSSLFLAALQIAEDPSERRRIFAATICLEDDESWIGPHWTTHHIHFPTDLPGGAPKESEVLDNPEDLTEATLKYLSEIDDSVPQLIEAVKSYIKASSKLVKVRDARSILLASLE